MNIDTPNRYDAILRESSLFPATFWRGSTNFSIALRIFGLKAWTQI
jgi:hypothetical protein